ncbi:glutathione S-transferase N-terminal domain-containing protein [Leptospira terpstrae]|uniref:glutathione S-transferase N-terminal domain-containing protein n=1 Tax=Leptospira terpstrae TaxID=293075 RepID=UPI003CFF33FC
MYQLYSNPRSPYSKRVHIYLLFRNLPYETILVTLEILENKKTFHPNQSLWKSSCFA